MMRPTVDRGWTLFLDRDGVLNRRVIGDYVRSVKDFEWLPGVLSALVLLRREFGRIVVVTNQQGIGKGLMTEEDVNRVHAALSAGAAAAGVHLDAILHCPALAADRDPCRKPSPGMALRARELFPEIAFERSVMVGDSPSDIGFGESLHMYTIGITTSYSNIDAREHHDSLLDFAMGWFPKAS